MDILLTSGLILLLINIATVVGPLLYMRWKTQRERQTQEAILRQNADRLKHGAWFRVRHASKSRFDTVWKLVPWDAAGILLVEADAVTLYRHKASGHTEELVFTPDNTRAEWIDTRLWPNGKLKWFMLNRDGQQHYFTSDTGMTTSNSDPSSRDIYVRTQMTLAGTTLEEELFPPSDFALDKNPHTMTALVILFGVIAYGLGDFFVNTETYAEAPLYTIYGGSALVVALATLTWLRGAGIPHPERLGLSVILGLAIGCALYPGLLRINQLTDDRGLQTYVYHLQDDLTLTPTNPELPKLVFPNAREYWESLETGSVHEFRLRQGSLGFYQIDMAPLYRKTQKFYTRLDAS